MTAASPAPGYPLLKFDAARRALAEATRIDEVKQARDRAEALRLYFRQQKHAHEMQNQCAEIKLRAERRTGEMLRETEKNRGGRLSRTGDRPSPVSTLADLGVTRKQASRWQVEASVPEEESEAYVEGTKTAGLELTQAGLLKLVRPTDGAAA